MKKIGVFFITLVVLFLTACQNQVKYEHKYVVNITNYLELFTLDMSEIDNQKVNVTLKPKSDDYLLDNLVVEFKLDGLTQENKKNTYKGFIDTNKSLSITISVSNELTDTLSLTVLNVEGFMLTNEIYPNYLTEKELDKQYQFELKTTLEKKLNSFSDNYQMTQKLLIEGQYIGKVEHEKYYVFNQNENYAQVIDQNGFGYLAQIEDAFTNVYEISKYDTYHTTSSIVKIYETSLSEVDEIKLNFNFDGVYQIQKQDNKYRVIAKLDDMIDTLGLDQSLKLSLKPYLNLTTSSIIEFSEENFTIETVLLDDTVTVKVDTSYETTITKEKIEVNEHTLDKMIHDNLFTYDANGDFILYTLGRPGTYYMKFEAKDLYYALVLEASKDFTYQLLDESLNKTNFSSVQTNDPKLTNRLVTIIPGTYYLEITTYDKNAFGFSLAPIKADKVVIVLSNPDYTGMSQFEKQLDNMYDRVTFKIELEQETELFMEITEGHLPSLSILNQTNIIFYNVNYKDGGFTFKLGAGTYYLVLRDQINIVIKGNLNIT